MVRLLLGLALFGIGAGLLVRGNLGLDPWDVLHQGLSRALHIDFGAVVIGVGIVVLLLWIPLRQRVGIGTLANVVVVGLAADATLALVPQPTSYWWRAPLMLAGIAVTGAASGLYIGAGLGPGPRDGLMTGLNRRGVGSIRLVRTGIELSVLAAGWLLGGSVGIGTVLFAVAIGPLVQVFLRLLAVDQVRRT